MKQDGTVWAWGSGSAGQLGSGATSSNTPVQVNGLDDVVSIAAGTSHALALAEGGLVWVWGANGRGQLGNGSTTSSSTPETLDGFFASALAAGGHHSVAAKADGSVWTWGSNDQGELGIGSTTDDSVPVRVTTLSSIEQVSAGVDHTVALGADGSAYSWGDNSSGQIGDGTTLDRHAPVGLDDPTPTTLIAAGGGRTVASCDATAGSGNSGPGRAARSGSELYGASNPGQAGSPHCQVGDPVTCATGNLTETMTDLTVAGRGRRLTFSRTYNALAAASAASAADLGWGWSHAYSQRLAFDPVTGAVTVHHDNGSTVKFSHDTSGYTANASVISSLTHNPDGTYTYRLPDQSIDKFDSAGRLVAMSDANGYMTTVEYSGGRVASVTEPAGRSLEFSYNADSRISEITDPKGRSITFGYDAAGHLTSVTDPEDHQTTYSYDSQHRLTEMENPRGGTTTNEYDDDHRVVLQRDPMDREIEFAYNGNTTTITNARGYVSVLSFSSGADLTRRTDGYGTADEATWEFSHDPAGNVIQAIDPNGNEWNSLWDSAGNCTSSTNPLGHTKSATYNSFNRLTSITDELGSTSSFDYDSNGNLLTATRPTASGGTGTTTLAYDPSRPGDVIRKTDALGRVARYGYDADGNLTSKTDPTGGRTTFDHNAIGWVTAIVSPRGNVVGASPSDYRSTISYDNAGHIVEATYARGGVSNATYDANGNRTSVTDASDHTTTWSYNAADEVSSVEHPDGTVDATLFDANGNVVRQTNGLNHSTHYLYDALDRVTEVSDPLDRETTFEYDRNGRLVARVDPLGRTTSYGYDEGNQLVSVVYSDAQTPDVSYEYDAAGRRIEMTDGTGVTDVTYSPTGKLISSTDARDQSIEYTYDSADQITRMTITAAIGVKSETLGVDARALLQTVTIDRTYDDAGRLASVSDPAGRKTSFAYDADGNLAEERYPNGVVATFSTDRTGRSERISHVGPAGAFLDLAYTRTQAGLLSSEGSSGATVGYSYDQNDRLTQTTLPAGSPSVPTRSYSYDAAGNLKGRTVASDSVTYSHDAADQLTALRAADQVLTTYTYDDAGSRAKTQDVVGTTTDFGYDQENRLTSYVGPAANSVNPAIGAVAGLMVRATYSYDGDGLRADLLWDRSSSLPAVVSDALAIYITGPRGLPVERIDAAGNALFYHQDQLGSTRAMTDASGKVIVTYRYDPHGNSVASSTAIANPFRFAGQFSDPKSGLMYMRARWYDPTTGRFITRDPMEALTREPYDYAGNNPVNYVDPTGKFWSWEDFTAVTGEMFTNPVESWKDGIGAGGICVGGDLVTPWGGVVAEACVVVARGQIGLTETWAAGSDVKGLSRGVNAGLMSSDACRIRDLRGPFAAVSGAAGPVGGSYQTGNTSGGQDVQVFQGGLGIGGGSWGGETQTKTQVAGSGATCGC